MSREAATLVMLAIAVVLLVLLGFAWKKRLSQHQKIQAPFGDFPAGATVRASYPGLYVASTLPDQPLERFSVKGLVYRSKADLVVSDWGIGLDLLGQRRIFIASSALISASVANVAIDRVVEPEGLLLLRWRLTPDLIIDSYFRPQQHSTKKLAQILTTLIPSTQVGETE